FGASLPSAGEPSAEGAAEGAAEYPELRMPFAWNEIMLHAGGVADLRVRLAPEGTDGVSIAIADDLGAPVASIRSLVTRRVAVSQLPARVGEEQGERSGERKRERPARRPPRAGGSLARRLAAVSGEEDRRRLLLETVRGEVAAILGHDSPAAVNVQNAF